MIPHKDWDYVSMADYQHDMRELSNQAAALIDSLMREKRELERTIWLLIHAAGGKIRVNRNARFHYDAKNSETIHEIDMATDDDLWQAKLVEPVVHDMLREETNG